MGARVGRFLSSLPFWKNDDEEDELKIVSRAEWKARVPKWREDLVYPALSATTVYTGTPPCSGPEECARAVQDLQAQHMDEDKLPDIEYSFLIGGDGRIYEGRGWQTISSRSTLVTCKDPEFPPPPVVMSNESLKLSPDRQIVIAFIGDEKKNKATTLMESAARDLINYGINYFFLYSDDHDEVTDDRFTKMAGAKKKKDEKEESESGSDDCGCEDDD